jgi:hypothetical protein
MHIAERRDGDHHIYAAASETPVGGFFAGCVVMRRAPAPLTPSEVFRDERLEDGRVWIDPAQALAFALEVGVAAVRAQAWFASSRAAECEEFHFA